MPKPIRSRSPLMRQVRRIAKDDGRTVERAVWGTDLHLTTWWRWLKEADPPQLVALEQVMRNYGYAVVLVPIEQAEQAEEPDKGDA